MRSTLEGLEHSRLPCTEVLSVAGFPVLLVRFLAGRRFILREERASSGPERPPLFNTNSETGDVTGAVRTAVCISGVYGRAYIPGCTYQEYLGKHIAQYTSLLRVLGRHIAQYTSLLRRIPGYTTRVIPPGYTFLSGSPCFDKTLERH